MENELQNDNFKGALFQNFENDTLEAPEIVWDNIESRLFRQQKRKRFFWLFSLVLLGALGTGTYFLMNTQKAAINNTTVVLSKKETKANSKAVSSTNNSVDDKNEATPLKNAEVVQNQFKTPIEKQQVIATTRTSKDYITNATTTSEQAASTTNVIEPLTQIPTVVPISDTSRVRGDFFRFPFLKPMLFTSAVLVNKLLLSKASKEMQSKFSFSVSANRGINVRKIEGDFNTISMKSRNIGDRRIPTQLNLLQLNTNYHFNQKFALNTGVSFGKSSFQSRWFYRQFFLENNESEIELRTMNGNANLNDAEILSDLETGDTVLYKLRANYNAAFLSIPIGFTYRFNTQKWSPYVRYALSVDVHSKAAISLDVQRNGALKTIDLALLNNVPRITLQQVASVGVDVNLNARWNAFLETKIAVPVSKMNVATDYKLRSSYVTVGFGMLYKLPLKNNK